MLYILLNNTYHITDLEKYLNTETVSQITYITVPVQLDSSLIRLPNIQLPAINVKELIRNYWAAKYKIAQIKKSIKPNNDDTLIVFSEIQLSNQIVIQEFSKAKAKVFLIEDGTATPILFNTQLQGSDAKSILLKFFLQYVIGFPDIRVTNHDNGYFYHMADKIFSGVIQFSEYSIKRNIKQYKLHSRPTALSFSKNTNNCIFFNQHLYQVYVDFETFMHELDKIINALVKKFDKVYFKFHPNEKREDVVKIKKILSQKYVLNIQI